MLLPPWHLRAKRRGSIMLLSAILIVTIVALVAFAVDISWLVLTRSELQNAADSAALAGANRLGDNYVLYSLPTQSATNKATLISNAVTTAKAAAQTYASANSAGGVASLTLLTTDIDVGYTDTTGVYTSNTVNATLYPNTIKVTMRRDSTANTSLNMFFAPVIGVSNIDVQAKASAMAYGATQVNSFRTDLGVAAGFLPVTFDANYWDNFISTGKDADGNISTDSSGNPQLLVYPGVKDTGNFGWLSLNDNNTGDSTLRAWISTGPTNSDIKALVDNNLMPLSSHNTNSWDWNGVSGFKSGSVSDVNVHIGKTFIMALFKPYNTGTASTNLIDQILKGNDGKTEDYQAGTGTGSNYNYNVVRFVGVKIMQPPSTGRDIVVQPVPITDTNMILGSGTTAPLSSSGSTSVTALAPPKLIY